ncbi:MAG: VIT1/CCC1 transporter family protein [Chloroflexota bacterium]
MSHAEAEHTLDRDTRSKVMTAQRNEITEYHIYEKLARLIRDRHNSDVLARISRQELAHYDFWRGYTGVDVKPARRKIWKYTTLARLLGLTFAIKLMERGEEEAQVSYDALSKAIPAATAVLKDEDEHETELVNMLDEERLKYVGSIVLGLNDALVELTGALAGLTLALQNARLIATAGLITGLAASLSMAASEYLSRKSEENGQSPTKSAIYTGTAYVLTVMFLIFPFLLFTNVYFSLGFTIFNAVLVILVFNYYVSVSRDISFKARFSEMTAISLGIATISFGIGFIVRSVLGVEV